VQKFRIFAVAKSGTRRTLCAMNKENSRLDTTFVEVAGEDTVTDNPIPSGASSPALGMGSRQLRANFETILRERGIYYPVAYRFLKELGRGRQGTVFLGLRQGARGCVTRHAIKIFDPAIYRSAKMYWTDMGRIAAQISRLHTVNSPNLVGRDIYDESNGIGYIQMEAVDGLDLRQFLDGGHLPKAKQRSSAEEWARFTDVIFRKDDRKLAIQPGIALHIMRQILRGLEVLHEQGFVHSDVKPGNIMIDRLGYVKLIDFGRAVMANEKMSILLGSPLYMAPETHRREPSLISSDLYSVGLVGLELLRGEPLLKKEGMTEKGLLEAKLALPDRLADLLPDYVRQNEAFVHLLRRFIEPDPAKRYSSAEAAESSDEGLRIVHKQLSQLGKDTQYERELSRYFLKLVNRRSARMEEEAWV